MPIDFEKETYWQEESSSHWFINIRPSCDICGKVCSKVLEYKINEEDTGTRVCFDSLENNCMSQAMLVLFAQNLDADYLWTRLIEYRQIGKANIKLIKRKREPMGLSKRYAVLNRDGFLCVLCGASGKNAKLEVDHKMPVSSGGSNAMNNLQTLCFKCNRGKGGRVG